MAIIGAETMWPNEKTTKIFDVKDGTSNTILVVEVFNSGVHWMEPRDFHTTQMAPGINPPQGQGISSAHPNGAQVGFVDGSVRWLNNKLPSELLRGLITRDGGEK